MKEFAKLAIDFYDHPRFIAAGLAATGLWACGLAYSLKHHDPERPGVITKEADFLRRPGAAVAAKDLVRVGLWLDRGDLYEIHNFEANADTADALEKRRADDRERARRHRLGRSTSRDESRDAHVTGHVTPSRDSEAPSRVTFARARVRASSPLGSSSLGSESGRGVQGGAGGFGFEVDAWVEGVRGATGSTILRPTGSPLRQLGELLAADGPKDPQERIEWARSEGVSFVAWAKARRTKVNVFAYGDWVAEGRPSPDDAAGRPSAPEPPPAPYHAEVKPRAPEGVLSVAENAQRAKELGDALARIGDGGVGARPVERPTR